MVFQAEASKYNADTSSNTTQGESFETYQTSGDLDSGRSHCHSRYGIDSKRPIPDGCYVLRIPILLADRCARGTTKFRYLQTESHEISHCRHRDLGHHRGASRLRRLKIEKEVTNYQSSIMRCQSGNAPSEFEFRSYVLVFSSGKITVKKISVRAI